MGAGTGFEAVLGGVMLILIVLALVHIILWILTLVYQAKRRQWVWFVATLLINPLFILYWLVWLVYPPLRKKPRKRR